MKAWETIERMEGSYGAWHYLIERTALTRDMRGRISEAAYMAVAFNSGKGIAINAIIGGSPGECLIAITKAIHAKEKE